MRDPDLISRKDIMAIVRVGATRVNKLQRTDPRFPKAKQITPTGKLYSRAEVKEYARNRHPEHGRPGRDRAFFERVAEVYRSSPRAPTRTVAEQLGGSWRTAVKWVARARALGLLEPPAWRRADD